MAAEISGLSQLALSRRPQVREIGFLNGSFDPDNLGRRRLFVARSTAEGGRIDGYLLCNPARGGAEWSLQTYQQRPGAVRGTIPYLMHQALVQFQAEGIERASLCVVPAVSLTDLQPGESRLVRGMLAASRFHLRCGGVVPIQEPVSAGDRAAVLVCESAGDGGVAVELHPDQRSAGVEYAEGDAAAGAAAGTDEASRAAATRGRGGEDEFGDCCAGGRQSVIWSLISSELDFSSGAYIALPRAGRALNLPGISARSL